MNKEELVKFLVKNHGKLDAISPLMSFGAPITTIYDVIVDVDENKKYIMLSNILENGIGVSEEDKKEIINEVLNRLPIAEEVSV